MSEVAVIGAGTMGHGIAQVAARAGYTVALADATRELAEAGLDRTAASLAEGVRRGKLTEAERSAALARISITSDVAAAATGVSLAIEAVPERLELKRAVLAQLDAAAPPDALLASNTSSLSITELQQATRVPARVIGMHFFNPVPVNPLLEIVPGGHTAEASVTLAVAVAARLGKEAIVVRDSPGFATSRLGVLLGLEAMRMLEEGVASAADIDRAMELGYRHPMGPLRLSDLVGLDVRLDIARELYRKLGAERFRPPAVLERLVAEGRLGRKSGAGFYQWPDPATAPPAGGAPAVPAPAPRGPGAELA